MNLLIYRFTELTQEQKAVYLFIIAIVLFFTYHLVKECVKLMIKRCSKKYRKG